MITYFTTLHYLIYCPMLMLMLMLDILLSWRRIIRVKEKKKAIGDKSICPCERSFA